MCIHMISTYTYHSPLVIEKKPAYFELLTTKMLLFIKENNIDHLNEIDNYNSIIQLHVALPSHLVQRYQRMTITVDLYVFI